MFVAPRIVRVSAKSRGALQSEFNATGRRCTSAAHLPPTQDSSSKDTTPPLLLEYSEFYVSHDGVSRTLYHMDGPPYTVEEIYDLTKAEKTYVLRAAVDPVLASPYTLPISPRVGISLAKIRVQEIDHGIETVGTGAVTWEASIAAALFFSCNPLYGDVLELGCGIGVQGILNAVGPILADDSNMRRLDSMTFTDYNEEVLRHCRLNIQAALGAFPVDAVSSIYVSRLDWNDLQESSGSTPGQKYHAIVACDCAYRYSDVEGICHAAKKLLHEDASSRIHLFGPYNRGVLHEAIRYMRDDMRMHVETELIDMNRCRLRPRVVDNGRQWKVLDIDQCVVAADTKAIFLHVTASNTVLDEKEKESLANID